MTADPDTTLRADARRNRDQILAAAFGLPVRNGSISTVFPPSSRANAA